MILKYHNVRRSADSPEEVRKLIEEGFVPIKDKAELPPEEPEELEVPDLSQMTKSELVALAVAAGIPGAKSLKKSELLEVLS